MMRAATIRLVSGVVPHRGLVVAWAILSPLVLVAASTEWLYTPEGYLDPWDYVGYFLSYDQPEFLAGRYKLARLPWILSGWAVHALFSDAAAPLLLHIGFLLLSSAGMYALVKGLFGSMTVAALTAILLGFYPHFHGSGGWDYHNTAAGAFHIWALVALTYASRTRSITAMMVSGGLVALAIHANITLVNVVPLFAVHLYVVARRHAPVPAPVALVAVLWVAAGGLVTTAGLMAVNVAAGRDPQFFRTLVAIVFRYTADPSAQTAWWKPWGAWVLSASHLALPITTAVIVAAVIVARPDAPFDAPQTRNRRVRRNRRPLVHLADAGPDRARLGLFRLSAHSPDLPGAGALLHWRSRTIPVATVLVAPVAIGAALSFNAGLVVQPLLLFLRSPAGIVPAVVACLLAAAVMWLPLRIGTVAAICFWSVGNALTAPVPLRYALRNPCPTAEPFQQAVIAVHRYVAETDPAFEDVTIWFKENEQLAVGEGCRINLGYLGYAVAASGVPYLSNPFPMPPIEQIPADDIKKVTRPRRTLLVLSAVPEADVTVSRHLAAIGLRSRPVRERRFTVLAGDFSAYLLALDPELPIASAAHQDNSGPIRHATMMAGHDVKTFRAVSRPNTN